LAFDFSGKTAPEASDDVAPAILAVAEGGTEPEVLRSKWDPATQTLSAHTDHLSSFFPISVDLKALGTNFSNAVNGFLGLAGAKPACVGQSLIVDTTTYTVEPESIPAAWPCLSASGDAISVDLSSNSPNAWIVRSEPVAAEKNVDLSPDFKNLVGRAAYDTLFAGSVGNGTVLLPSGSTHLRFVKANPPHQVTLRADPGMTLINGFIVGLDTLFPNSKLLSVPGMLDCVKPLVPKFTEFGSKWNGDRKRYKRIDRLRNLYDRRSVEQA
jgi:hypothetical protein